MPHSRVISLAPQGRYSISASVREPPIMPLYDKKRPLAYLAVVCYLDDSPLEEQWARTRTLLDWQIGQRALFVVQRHDRLADTHMTAVKLKIRFGANHSAEDETDLSKVNLDVDLFAAYTAAFLEGTGGSLTDAEIEYLLAVLGPAQLVLGHGVLELGQAVLGVVEIGDRLIEGLGRIALQEPLEAAEGSGTGRGTSTIPSASTLSLRTSAAGGLSSSA